MDKPVRKPTRIPNYDYSKDNYYFVTICTHEKKCIFGTVREIGRYGKIAADSIDTLSSHYSNVKIDKYVVMPNHIHMIVVIGCNTEISVNPTLSQIIGAYKSEVTRLIHQSALNVQIWQRSFHDHVIRNQRDYERIWNYIHTNPMRWDKDCFYVDI